MDLDINKIRAKYGLDPIEELTQKEIESFKRQAPMKTKQYRLLKDTPEVKKGELVTFKDASLNMEAAYFAECGKIAFHHKTVEDQPDWFEEVKEDSYKILSFIHKENKSLFKRDANGHFYKQGDRLELIFSEMTCLSADFKLTIHSVERISDNKTFTLGDAVYYNKGVVLGEPFIIDNFFIRASDNTLLAIGKGNDPVEFLDQNLFKVEKKEVSSKDYVILKYQSLMNSKHFSDVKRGGFLHDNYWRIYSVKRLSDSTTFTLDQEVELPFTKKYDFKIYSFEEKKDSFLVKIKSNIDDISVVELSDLILISNTTENKKEPYQPREYEQALLDRKEELERAIKENSALGFFRKGEWFTELNDIKYALERKKAYRDIYIPKEEKVCYPIEAIALNQPKHDGMKELRASFISDVDKNIYMQKIVNEYKTTYPSTPKESNYLTAFETYLVNKLFEIKKTI